MPPNSTDAVIVGAGACGGVVALRLAERGLKVTLLEAGPRFDTAADLPNSESNAAKIMWNEPRAWIGRDGVVPKSGTGVGGGTNAWLGVMPRFRAEDFRARSLDGVGDDWPIGYDDLRLHYARIEHEFGVAGECGPFAQEPYTLPMLPHRMNWHAQVLSRGPAALGASPFAPPVAINSTERDGRAACVYCGWCASGCGIEAKATAGNTYLAKAERLGARITPRAFACRVGYDAPTNRVTGVEYIDENGSRHWIGARIVVLAAHAFESPRLLLLSANATFPQGLANSSGRVGHYLMSHPTWQVFGTFDEPINAFKGMQMGHVMVQDYYRTDPSRGCQRGFVLLSYMMTPITYANLSGSFHGLEFKRFLRDYAHTAAWWAHAEGLPHESNRVTLDPRLTDARGLPAARVEYAWCENDVRLAAAARDKAAEMMAASGARHVRVGLNYGAHAMGTCRMGSDPATSVVDDSCRTHDIPNLYVCDTSVFVTGGGLNPTLTAMAIADRAAARMVESAARGEW